MGTVLFCTVGGSHQPIVTAIHHAQPQRVVFFCTDTDPATGKRGSRVQVEGKGLFIKAQATDERPTLPNIPTQCQLAEGAWEVVVVPADDLDEAYVTMRAAIAAERAAHPDDNLVADYTGGTKTMTAALVLAGLDEGDVFLQLVAGARADLVRVRDGTQAPVPAAVDIIRLRRDMAPFLAAWNRYAYDEVATGLAQLPAPRDRRLRAEWQRARDISAALAAWDRFDHTAALDRLAIYQATVAPKLGILYPSLKQLARGREAAQDGLRLWDLWQNALRRAVGGRYDDAVARAYRLLEWTVQWVLKTEKGWDTADLSEAIALAAGIVPSRDGRFQAPLYTAWKLAAEHCPGPAADFFRTEGDALLDQLRVRNESILAHGFVSVDAAQWATFESWLVRRFEPLLRSLLAHQRIRPFPQLPTAYLFSEDRASRAR